MSERTKREIVCVGLALLAKTKKLVPEFREVVDGAVDEQPLLWEGVKGSPGNVYSIESTTWERGISHMVFIPKGGRLPWLRLWHRQEDRLLWEAVADAAQAELAREKLRADAEKTSELAELIAPLARIYHSLGVMNRTAFLMRVQEQIIRQRPKGNG